MRSGPAPDLIVEPFLHQEKKRLYNPLSDQALTVGQPGYKELLGLIRGRISPGDLAGPVKELLSAQGWLVEDGPDLATRFLLKYVSLEGTSVCNQACYFCPVSVEPRDHAFMSLELYESIVRQLAAFKETIEVVFMNQYNEPTVDRHFLERVKILKNYHLPPAILTNGSGLSPDRIEALLEMGGVRYFSANLSTLDPDQYARDRGRAHLELVLRNLDYLKDRPLAELMDLVVLGLGHRAHRRSFKEIKKRYAGSRFRVRYFKVTDRARYLDLDIKPLRPDLRLRGCEQTGSRPLQHLHITAQGKCVLCCQDYSERYQVGDLTRESVEEVLTGPALARLRGWAYGLEQAPDDFICRRCIFALGR